MRNVNRSFTQRDLDSACQVYAKSISSVLTETRTLKNITISLDDGHNVAFETTLEPCRTPDQSKPQYKATCRYTLCCYKARTTDVEPRLSESVQVVFWVFYHLHCNVVLAPSDGHNWSGESGFTNSWGAQCGNNMSTTLDQSKYEAVATWDEPIGTPSKMVTAGAVVEERSQLSRMHPDNIVS